MLTLRHKVMKKPSKLANFSLRKALSSIKHTPQCWLVPSKHGTTYQRRWVRHGYQPSAHGDWMSVTMALCRVLIRQRPPRSMERRRSPSGEEVMTFHHQRLILMTRDIHDSIGDTRRWQTMCFQGPSHLPPPSTECFHTGTITSAHRSSRASAWL